MDSQHSESQHQNQMIALVLISGPPGIGKSTFGLMLKEFILAKSNTTTGYHTILFSFDKILDQSLESHLINSAAWKTGRLIICKLIETLVGYLNSKREQDVETFFNQHLDVNLNKSSLFLVLKTNFFKCFKEQANLFFHYNDANNKGFILLLDDIFYYESMRLIYYRLASECMFQNTVYFNFCFKACSIDLLLNRNKTRPSQDQLDQKIIENIFNKFDCPLQIAWEKEFSHIINIEIDDYSFLNEMNLLEILFNSFEKFENHLVLKKNNQQQREQDFIVTNSSVLHQADLSLRKLVSRLVSDVRAVAEQSDINKQQQIALKAAELNRAKSIILNQLRKLETNEQIDFYFRLESLVNDSTRFDAELETKFYSLTK
jgi:tRNA uridine 5-carbamoylmethylation protein Kti12